MQIWKKTKNWFSDRYHLLFKSAAVNHLRIQEVLKNSDGSYQLSLRFASYSELKQYQRKLRRMTVSLSSAIAMVVVAFIVAPYILNPNRSSAAAFLWTQNSWVGAGTGAVKQYPADNSGSTDYTSKNNIDISSGKITLPVPQPSSTGDSSYAGVPGGGFYTADANGNYSAVGTSLALKKPVDATCTNVAECNTPVCQKGKCCMDACCGVTSITDTRDTNNPTYNTVAIGSQCWLNRSLNVGTMLAAATTQPSDPFSFSAPQKWCANNLESNCASGAGIYTWAEANGLSSSCNTNSCSVGAVNQGICPAGWHIPTDNELFVLEDYLKDAGIACSPTRYNLSGCATAGTKLRTGGSSGFEWRQLTWIMSGAFRSSYGFLLSSTEYSSSAYIVRSVGNTDTAVTRTSATKSDGLVVRCIKN